MQRIRPGPWFDHLVALHILSAAAGVLGVAVVHSSEAGLQSMCPGRNEDDCEMSPESESRVSQVVQNVSQMTMTFPFETAEAM